MKDRLFIIIMMTAVIFLTPLFSKSAKIPDITEKTSAVVFPETVRLLRSETGEVETLSAQEYIAGCLAAQIPIDYEQEALNAQAAASATYAMRLMLDLKKQSGVIPYNADISDSADICQAYLSPSECTERYGEAYNQHAENLLLAARYGISHIMTYENAPIYAVYHSVSAGRTCSAYPVWGREIAYLKPAESPWDSGYMHFECSNEMTSEAARVALAAYKDGIEAPADCAKWFTEMNVNEDGYVISVKIGGNTFSGGDIWRIFGLRSTAFTVSYADGIFTFVTKGYGHGAGLSQYGAQCMAISGASADEILRHYYGEKITVG